MNLEKIKDFVLGNIPLIVGLLFAIIAWVGTYISFPEDSIFILVFIASCVASVFVGFASSLIATAIEDEINW